MPPNILQKSTDFSFPSRRFYVVISGNSNVEALVYGDLICIKLNHSDISEMLGSGRTYSLLLRVQGGSCNKSLNFLKNSIARPSGSGGLCPCRKIIILSIHPH